MTDRMKGYCPMGCGETLFIGAGGHVTCSYVECPDPCAVDLILSERETEHIVTIGLNTFTVRHPLRERVDRQGFSMEDCSLHLWLHEQPGPPVKPGRYRAAATSDGWAFRELA